LASKIGLPRMVDGFSGGNNPSSANSRGGSTDIAAIPNNTTASKATAIHIHRIALLFMVIS
jgi:hypothetical protein